MIRENCCVKYCNRLAEVYCDCRVPEMSFCGNHGYEHFCAFGHEMKDIKIHTSDLSFLDIDLALMTGNHFKYSDITEGPSMFQKMMLKHLKNMSEECLEKFDISDDLKQYLFEVKYKIPCFECKKAVSYIKLHLFNTHNMDETRRKQYWDTYSETYSRMNLILTDIV
ncbi:hypothetical protein SteCoe_4554 [Stentor coeruleus]|uniref:Uncharacterized protein n=1 Tax=Stentor coeruleus TaxID=5963 RepID=A0A1R2CUM1_9CILI|nr:hypothetical protein SteCoe_4554 [Stentor coeruleus]